MSAGMHLESNDEAQTPHTRGSQQEQNFELILSRLMVPVLKARCHAVRNGT